MWRFSRYCPGFKGDWYGIKIYDCKFDENVYVAHHAELLHSYIGNHSSIGRYTKVRETDMGKYCSISWQCTIGAPTHPYKTITNSALTYRKEYGVVDKDIFNEQKRTIIGNDVWIGQDVTILPGVHIGDGAVIGLNSVVASDVEPYTIVAGNPAKPIRKRLDDEMIQLMLQLKWWDKPVDEINKIIPIITI